MRLCSIRAAGEVDLPRMGHCGTYTRHPDTFTIYIDWIPRRDGGDDIRDQGKEKGEDEKEKESSSFVTAPSSPSPRSSVSRRARCQPGAGADQKGEGGGRKGDGLKALSLDALIESSSLSFSPPSPNNTATSSTGRRTKTFAEDWT